MTHPTGPDAVRAELAQTRARMSETIDEIEGVLLGKKESLLRTAKGIQQRLDPFYKVRERPLAAVGIVFGIGLAFGVFSGRKRTVVVTPPPAPPAPPEADLWERRARRLLRIAREQEEQLGSLQERVSSLEHPEYEEVEDDDDDINDEHYPVDDDAAEDGGDAADVRGFAGRVRDRLHRFRGDDGSV